VVIAGDLSLTGGDAVVHCHLEPVSDDLEHHLVTHLQAKEISKVIPPIVVDDWLHGVFFGLLVATVSGLDIRVRVEGMGMHRPYVSRSVIDLHYQGEGAPANVLPKRLWDEEHIQVIFFQLDAPALRTPHVGTVANLGSVARRAVVTSQILKQRKNKFFLFPKFGTNKNFNGVRGCA
jgi:hypothetical protein